MITTVLQFVMTNSREEKMTINIPYAKEEITKSEVQSIITVLKANPIFTGKYEVFSDVVSARLVQTTYKGFEIGN